MGIPAVDILIGVVNFVNQCLVVVDPRFDLAMARVADGGDFEDLRSTCRLGFCSEKWGFSNLWVLD